MFCTTVDAYMLNPSMNVMDPGMSATLEFTTVTPASYIWSCIGSDVVESESYTFRTTSLVGEALEQNLHTDQTEPNRELFHDQGDHFTRDVIVDV